ncbi:L-type lectin-domain containing receptor kinase VIII.1-like isoform X2 [Cucumis melo var. makuwa]|uniref:L-type lectin-domain containing receptor kinase VIII.1-like isoform X2 n=1 Tax=Cucumis melo var. makuwa TaxID=1194695 RepID=A0A5A7TZF8_CUCMM|nr:L-type lectin-domain containing receptor kinase VIII.1-like isoform X2 [Cucumis melo var. makuwa]TYK22532.1 L-type lectin-domain containing receptor kinase VIII.1-like isoform X2 [Cucumis melo var. makuwa]
MGPTLPSSSPRRPPPSSSHPSPFSRSTHDKSPNATVAIGIMGYYKPEYLLTRRATEKTDVFNFDAVDEIESED